MYKKLDYEEVKRAARETKTQPEFAAEIGIGLSTVHYRRNNDPEFKKAYEAGVAEREAGSITPVEEKSKTINYTPEDFYKWGKEKMSNGEMAAFYGTSVIRISQLLKKPDLREAYEKGKAGLEFTDEFSTVAMLLKNSKTDFLPGQVSQDSKLGQYQTNIIEAVRLGYETVASISGFCGADMVTVQNCLLHLAAEKTLEKKQVGDNSHG